MSAGCASLILDEPTCAVDTGTETEGLDAMRSLVKGRTAFVIAHRLSTLTPWDVLAAIENGYLNLRSCRVPTAVR